MKKKLIGCASLLLVLSLGLAACGSGGKKEEKETAKEELKFAKEVKNEDEGIAGGTLKIAIAADTQFPGIFDSNFSSNSLDTTIMKGAFESLIKYDDEGKLVEGGPADFEIDVDNKKARIILREDLKWSDGQAVTTDDVIFPYEIIGHKDYSGVRYGSKMETIVGMKEYHEGKTDKISGIKAVDERTVEITYTEMNPAIKLAGGVLWNNATPKHVFEGIAVKDMETSDPVRKNPVTLGAFKLNKFVSGESATFVANEHYYGGKPKIDKIVKTIVPTASIVESMKSKEYDLVEDMPVDSYDTYKDLDGYQILGELQNAYTYLGFKMGKWDAEKSAVAYDENAKMANKNLRQAMGYAINTEAIADKFYHGLRDTTNSLIISFFASVHNPDQKGYTYDHEKAKELLDEAGYKDTDDDGIREDPKGEKLVINFACRKNEEISQALADYMIQEWEKIGLKVELSGGRLMDSQAFYKKLQEDDPEIDVYNAAWVTGLDPAPTGLYGRNSEFNYTRFASEENDKLLKALESDKTFDEEERKKAFYDWQEYAKKEAFVIPTTNYYTIMPVSNRVKNLVLSSEKMDWSKLELTADKLQ
ncbi:oligopeptide ABC transporter substrate-binding protein [Enterococcus sp. AZ192]|uniref:oligopeptide ABC transporter substrate-binding protein n=1 Tax=unclassified Enterococcus TaxID=2608891 RepID=UPI003D290270